MPGRPLKLMIVEDEFIIADDLEAGVESIGHVVCANVTSAEEALEQAAQEPPDIVLMDIRLAGEMDGIEAAELFRSRWETPVIFITAHANQAGLERAKLTLPFGYLLKPIDFQTLRVTIEMAFYTSRVDAERRRAEEALRESEEKWRSITEYSPDHIMLLGLDGTIRFINFTVPDLTREEVVGKPVYDFFPAEFHQAAADCFAKVAATGEPGSYDTEYHATTGEVRIFESRVGPVFRAGEVVALTVRSTDITERRQAVEVLRQSEERYRTLVDNIPGAVYRCRPQPPWEVVHMSGEIASITGYPAAHFVSGSLHLASHLRPEDSERLTRTLAQAVRDHQPYEIEYRSRHADGRMRWIFNRGRATYDDHGKALWVDGVLLDFTRTRHLDERL